MLNRLKEIFGSFQNHDVKYLVIGGIAAVLYGVPRATFDLDILIEPTLENARRLLSALLDSGLGTASLTNAEEVVSTEITVFKDRVRLDVQTKTPGIEFGDAWARKSVMTYQGQQLFVSSLQDLIASKRAAGRPVDLEDVRILEMSDESKDSS